MDNFKILSDKADMPDENKDYRSHYLSDKADRYDM
jgi:hypothetical protein